MIRTLRNRTPEAYQLAMYLRKTYGYEHSFVAEVVNREFGTDYCTKRMRYAWRNFVRSGKELATDLIQDFMPGEEAETA